ncbi:S-adenosylmethionine decarboxylase proenzyme [Thermodesulfatator indicus DSM 15286]|uniref:S-adenosylmethionine decarboxylase proenzyme n=1 Tax=Thermodesulfatator indicus (strain DSM 15286 / JCM 11887 / CIR29812) TaxID=667014 RepID=F8A889_THEID|nr:adenosylmethionine decarboxylase [Thermodesulfatator indicus]AEH44540.1 S-adenosylmethionine decarboxylase proenzyme [Thermodesulfatator indicus DSM 15286]
MRAPATVCQIDRFPAQGAQKATETGFISTHLLVEMWQSPFNLLADAKVVEKALRYGGSGDYHDEQGEVISYQFSPYGVSAKATFGDAHIFIHTWPENGYAAIDIFAGSDEEAYEIFERLKEAFKPHYVHALEMKRGQLIEMEET